MNRQLLLGLGLLATSMVAVMPGCSDDDTSGDNDNKAGESNSAGQNSSAGKNNSAGQSNSAGESAGGTGSVVTPAGGEGGVGQSQGGVPPVAQGGMSAVDAGAGGMSAGGVGGAPGPDNCILPSSYGNLTILQGDVEFDDGFAQWQGSVPVSGEIDGSIDIELFEGIAPPFEDGITTVTNHVLAGDDLNYATCGLCVRMKAIREVGDAYVVQDYFVTGGTISLTSVEGHVTGTASNLTFEEVTFDDDFTSIPVEDGCSSAISGVSFDGVGPVDGAGGAGGAGG